MTDDDLRALVQRLRDVDKDVRAVRSRGAGGISLALTGLITDVLQEAANELESLLARAEAAEEQVRHLERRVRDLTEEKNCAVLDKRHAEAECARLRLQLQIINDPDDEPSAGDYGCTR